MSTLYGLAALHLSHFEHDRILVSSAYGLAVVQLSHFEHRRVARSSLSGEIASMRRPVRSRVWAPASHRGLERAALNDLSALTGAPWLSEEGVNQLRCSSGEHTGRPDDVGASLGEGICGAPPLLISPPAPLNAGGAVWLHIRRRAPGAGATVRIGYRAPMLS